MKNVVVTGGAGFLGSHLCDALLAKGCRVTCVDNFVTGDAVNIAHLKDNPGFSIAAVDISRQPLNALADQEFDTIFNLASPASPVDYQKLPIETLKVGAFGTCNLLELAKANKARVLHASTSEVYGDPLEHPQKETYFGNVNPIGIRSCYDESKRFAEALCMAFYREYGLDVRMVRIFNTYGPRMRLNDGRVVPNFVSQALSNQSITVYGDGSQTRSFCFIKDLIQGIVLAAEKPDLGGQVINLGNPEEHTILELAQAIVKLTGSSSQIVFKPLPGDDPGRRKPDITKAQQLLGWSPTTGLEAGLSETIDFFKQKISRP